MLVKYDREKLQQLLKDYTRLTGLSIAVVDDQCVLIASSISASAGFCSRIQQTAEGAEKCLGSDRELLCRCRQSHRPEWHICHAGLTDAAIPIRQGEQPLGYVLLGQMRRDEAPPPNFAGDAVLETAYHKLHRYDAARMSSAINLATALATLMLADGMVRPAHDAVSEAAAAYIREHLTEPLSVEMLCRQLRVSKNELYERFRYTLHATVGQFITQCRIERMKILLSTTDKSLAAVAEECGVENYTYFIKLFKKHTGVTPLQYRKQNLMG